MPRKYVRSSVPGVRRFEAESAEISVDTAIIEEAPTPEAPEESLPPGWRKGALLNVRNYGPEYIITLWPEEYDPLKPERAMRFGDPGACQNFVSDWYSRETADPRAR